MILHASITSDGEVSITVLFCYVHPHYTAVRINNCSKGTSVIKVATIKKYDCAARPIYHLKLKYPIPFSVSYFQLVIHSSTNQELFEKHPCSHYEKYGRFRYALKEAISQFNTFHCQQR